MVNPRWCKVVNKNVLRIVPQHTINKSVYLNLSQGPPEEAYLLLNQTRHSIYCGQLRKIVMWVIAGFESQHDHVVFCVRLGDIRHKAYTSGYLSDCTEQG